MPISQDQALQVRDRLIQGRPADEMVGLLGATHPDERPVPPRVPCTREWSAEAHRKRVAFVEELGAEVPHLAGDAPYPDPATMRGSIENFIGYMQVPVGLIGPLRVNGIH